MATGKGAMVWRIREWFGGNVATQIAQCKDLRLDWLALKIVDGTFERWEGTLAHQNADYLPELIPALRENGIKPIGWGWTYGRGTALPYPSIAISEARLTGDLMDKHALDEYLIDAEGPYKRPLLNMAAEATKYVNELRIGLPNARLGLCSYRFPSVQTSFPFREFLARCDEHNPQVYWLDETSQTAGAENLAESFRELQAIKPLTFAPIGPTYLYANRWRATGVQIRLFLEKAVALACIGAGFWALEKANPDQLSAIRSFQWPGAQPPPLTIEAKVDRLWAAHPELHGVP